MFILGVLSERNLNIEKEIKDTSHNLAEEVNRLSGITKGLGEIKMQIHMEFDNKMKMMDQKMRDIEKILASADDTHSVSSKSSYPHDWNSLTKPVGTSSSTPKAARDYKALLLKLGFQEAHIKHPTMKKYQDQVVTPDMYDIVMGADAMSDDLREEFNQQILQGIKARQMAETSSIVRTSKPSSSAPVNKYDMEV
jgi:aminoglycoside/choline kinase family phosphotransferase